MKITATLALALTLSLYACSDGDSDNGNDNVNTNDTTIAKTDTAQLDAVLEAGGLKLVPLTGSPEFGDASLKLKKPAEGENAISNTPVFEFDVQNYELGVQSEDKSGLNLANSGMGQHIHVIVDNEPYTAHYHDTAKRELNPGRHLMLAFLSRSYHESIKTDQAFVLRSFNVGNTSDQTGYETGKPYLFYSRPKGSYTAAEMQNLLLDFYPVNVNIGTDHHVRVIIDGNQFTITEWKPYVVQGLSAGDHTFRIQLIDRDGNPVSGDFTDSGNRTVTLKQ